MARTNELADLSAKICFKYNSQLLLGFNDFFRNKETDNFKSWCIKDVSDFIKSIPGCSQFARKFELEVNICFLIF